MSKPLFGLGWPEKPIKQQRIQRHIPVYNMPVFLASKSNQHFEQQ
jgi:hypothetical protein